MESSCFRSRSSSPETPVRWSSGRPLSRPSRSRSPRSASALKEPEEPREIRALLGSGNDRVDLAVAKVLLGATEVVGQLLLHELLHDARAGEREQRAGLGDHDVAER